jgi:3,4-dihydroxy-2-butanone 4-phosphate synthase
MSISPVLDIVADLRAGRMVILVDEEDRENEGDLVIAAEHCTPEAINFMAKWGRGLICLTLTESRCRQLDLPLMVRDNKPPKASPPASRRRTVRARCWPPWPRTPDPLTSSSPDTSSR